MCRGSTAMSMTVWDPSPTNMCTSGRPASTSTTPIIIEEPTARPSACTMPRRIRRPLPAPTFWAANVVAARPRDCSSATPRPSTRAYVVYAATASGPRVLMRICTARLPIAMIEAWNPIGRPIRRCSAREARSTRQSSRTTCRTGTFARTCTRQARAEASWARHVASAAPAMPRPAPHHQTHHEHDVQHAGDHEVAQRCAGIADRADDRGEIVEEHDRARAEEADPCEERRLREQFGRGAQEGEHRPGRERPADGDDHADHSGEDRAGGHGAGDPAGISRAEGLRGGDRETGGHADREAEQQEQQAAGRADGGEGVHAEVTADHGGVGE